MTILVEKIPPCIITSGPDSENSGLTDEVNDAQNHKRSTTIIFRAVICKGNHQV